MGSSLDVGRAVSSHMLSHRDRFAGIKQGLAVEVESSIILIQELLQDLDSTKAALQETQLDLANECVARRRLQQEILDEKALAETRGRRPFVVALIDADTECYFFKDEFLSQGLAGGELAADALHTALRQFVQDIPSVPGNVDIIVKAFAKMSGLGPVLQQAGKVRTQEQLRAFAAGFSRRKPFFDFIDVGPMKEGADNKLKANAELFLDSFQCKHLVLGCVHDEGYATWLQPYVGDEHLASRMTLVEGDSFVPQMRRLNLNSARFDTVFQGVRDISASPSYASAAAEVASETRKFPRIDSSGIALLEVQAHRLGSVVLDASGNRVDRRLQVSKAVADRVSKSELCYWLYLRGRCEMVHHISHKRNHVHCALTDPEFDALWEQARMGKCWKSAKAEQGRGQGCVDPLCIYGHNK
ncbi:uncharacterized protein B0I36DRAFT_98658 [Microdochium trichocladiopsis]|uniref:DUF7923 domain-containing protein n=1 Tax=Microdochium trichocladiopsis TaxID=1682393 RepID=A0A9P9BU24_9PEZI|nr:uncharacterized protein B0I36DRAFT_98658 [Microdochium trichocladiopsis]KAH7036047.1 hypothetical protein B0I36DRAFT_98658 [Microdochium trichocladiopsis]